MLDVAVLGPGGVGGFLAAALARFVPTAVVAREATAREIAERGVDVESERLGSFHAEPRATSSLADRVDVLIVAPKARDLDAALERVEAEPDLVLPLLNGLDHMGPLRERFGPRAVAGSIRIEAYRTDPTHVVQTSPFLRIDMASADPEMHPRMQAFARVLDGAGRPGAGDRQRGAGAVGQARPAERDRACDERLRPAARPDQDHARAARRADGVRAGGRRGRGG